MSDFDEWLEELSSSTNSKSQLAPLAAASLVSLYRNLI